MTRFIATLALLALITFAVAPGCNRDQIKAPPPGRVDLLPASAYPQITATEGLSKWLRFGPPVVDHSAPPLHITIPLRSIYDKEALNIQYRFEFLDPQGRVLPGSAGWQFTHLEPRIESQLTGGALDAQATDWRLQVRPAR